ncbi:hypothetical protein ZHAS_00014359 [Anopheles sinensis]|uniref:Uncharacterized protein n=1 Tax=Anopheles sinensis TaxID=74873 RepID=A0A084W824_ANOSI|nr:hypothetical protein ZHAS_00014359 [Anopheles sinensis]
MRPKETRWTHQFSAEVQHDELHPAIGVRSVGFSLLNSIDSCHYVVLALLLSPEEKNTTSWMQDPRCTFRSLEEKGRPKRLGKPAEDTAPNTFTSNSSNIRRMRPPRSVSIIYPLRTHETQPPSRERRQRKASAVRLLLETQTLSKSAHYNRTADVAFLPTTETTDAQVVGNLDPFPERRECLIAGVRLPVQLHPQLLPLRSHWNRNRNPESV